MRTRNGQASPIVALALMLASTQARGQDKQITFTPDPSHQSLTTDFDNILARVALARQAPARKLSNFGPIREIRVEGLETIPEKDVRDKLKTCVGQPLQRELVDEDQLALERTNWFSTTILRVDRTPDGKGLILGVKVKEMPILRDVQIKGLEAAGGAETLREIEDATGLKAGNRADHVKCIMAVNQIRTLFEEKGYEKAEVRLLEGGKPGDTRLIIEIRPGPKIPLPPQAPTIPFPTPAKLIAPSFFPPFDPAVLPAGFAIPELTPRSHLEKAQTARKVGHWKEAIEETSQAIRVAPADPSAADALRLRSDVYESRGLFRQAIVDLDRVIGLGDPKGRDYLNRGWSYCKDRDFDRGMADIETSLRLATDDRDRAVALRYRGAALELRGDFQAGLADFDRVLALGFDTPYDRTQRGYCLARLGRHVEAIADFDRALPSRSDPEGWHARGQSRQALGQFAEALADHDRAVEAKPESARYRRGRAWTLLALGRLDDAIAEFTTVLEGPKLAPGQFRKTFGTLPPGFRGGLADQADALAGRGCAYLLRLDLDRAVADLDQAIAARTPGKLLIDWQFDREISLKPTNDRAVVEFYEHCRDAPYLPWALVLLKDEDARSQSLKAPYFAAYLVGRTRPDPSIAPSLIVRVVADWDADPEVKSACFARAIAASLRSEWSDALDYLEGVGDALVEAEHPGSSRPRTLAERP